MCTCALSHSSLFDGIKSLANIFEIVSIKSLANIFEIVSKGVKFFGILWSYFQVFVQFNLFDMSRVARKPIFGNSDQVRHKPGCTATEYGKKLEISDLGSREIVLSM